MIPAQTGTSNFFNIVCRLLIPNPGELAWQLTRPQSDIPALVESRRKQFGLEAATLLGRSGDQDPEIRAAVHIFNIVAVMIGDAKSMLTGIKINLPPEATIDASIIGTILSDRGWLVEEPSFDQGRRGWNATIRPQST